VEPGTYGILTIPKKDKWTVIFTKNNNQWGSYTYNEKEDLFRFEVNTKSLQTPVETFTISFSDVMPNSAKMNLSWEKTLITFDLTVDEDAEIMASIEEAMKGEKKPYFAAAQYYYKNNKDINKALEWVNKAEEQAPKATYIKYWKGLIQIKAGDKAGAIQTAQKGIEIAKQENNEEYIKLNGQVLQQAQR
jgi:tetratricopeptide (TPR) repeat protein